MTAYDAFEEKLADALHTEEMPSADFTARVMTQVAKTPQTKAGSSKRTWKIILTAAACFAVVAVALPLVFFGTMRAGSAAPEAADCAAPAEAEEAAMKPAAEADGGAVNDCVEDCMEMEETPLQSNLSAESEAVKEKTDATENSAYEEVAFGDTELCRQVREILGEMGLVSDSGTYVLTAEQVAVLQEALPELELPEGAFVLILEG